MSTVNTLAQSVSQIANRVNAHQILLEDLRTKLVSASASMLPSASSNSVETYNVQTDKIYKTIEEKMANLETEMKQMVNRQTKMLESTLKHENSQKISSAMADFDKSGTICILQQRLNLLDSRIETLSRLQAESFDTAQQPTIVVDSSPEPAFEVQSVDKEVGVVVCETTPSEAGETVAKPKASRRRSKPATKEKSVLSLE